MNHFIPPVSKELLYKYNFFELYPFDGGGHFITEEILGSLDDMEIAQTVLGGCLDIFGGLDSIDFNKFDRWTYIEQSSWINRLYFLVPLAKYAYIKNDEGLAKKVIDIILHFWDVCPAPDTKEKLLDFEKDVNIKRERDYNRGNLDGEISYGWYDFQPASRIIHILYALFFIKDFECFTESVKEKTDKILYHHGEILYWSESEYNLKPGNHQALRGYALMLICSYFNDERVKSWIPVAEEVCNYHIINDFLPDGMNLDISPSYHFFECWICRDILTLCDKYNYSISLLAKERVKKAFDLCFALCQPDGFSTVVSDGYPLNMNVFLTTLKKENENSNYIYLPDSQIGIWKENNNYLLFDCSPLVDKVSHFHGGKQSITLFFDGEAFIVDSGCCNYDHKEFAEYYKLSYAHSSLLVEEVGDSVIEGRYAWPYAPNCKMKSWQGNEIESSLVSSVSLWKNIIWTRKLNVSDEKLIINDTVYNTENRELTYIFNLDYRVKAELLENKVMLTKNNIMVEGVFEGCAELKTGLNYTNKSVSNIQIWVRTNKQNHKTVFYKK